MKRERKPSKECLTCKRFEWKTKDNRYWHCTWPSLRDIINIKPAKNCVLKEVRP